MNNIIIDLFDNIIVQRLELWHNQDLKHFTWEFIEQENTLAGLIERNIYYNYQGWHFEDLGQSDNPTDVMRGWKGSRENNRNRNQSIQYIDEYFIPFYSEEAEEYTETIGVILDKVSILYIKYLHLVENGDERCQILFSVIQKIIQRTNYICQNIMEGKIKCITIPHLKLYDKQHVISD